MEEPGLAGGEVEGEVEASPSFPSPCSSVEFPSTLETTLLKDSVNSSHIFSLIVPRRGKGFPFGFSRGLVVDWRDIFCNLEEEESSRERTEEEKDAVAEREREETKSNLNIFRG